MAKSQKTTKAVLTPTQAKKAVTKSGAAAAIAAAIANKPDSSKVTRAQIEKAVKALTAFNAKKEAAKPASKKADLLANDDDDEENLEDADPVSGKFFWLIVSTKKMPSSIKIKPVKIPIMHSITAKNAEVCLFTKDPQKDYKDLLEEKGIKIEKVIGVSKLKANYHSYEAKRQLCDSFDMFLTDDRIVSLLPPLLGKTFFARKRHPVPVNLKAKNVATEIEKAISGTYLHLNKGLCNSVKIGTTNQSETKVVDNIYFALETIVARVPGKWPNIQSIHVKLSDSVSLPLYNSLPEPDIEIEVAAPKKDKKKAAVVEEPVKEDDDVMEDVEEASPPAKKMAPAVAPKKSPVAGKVAPKVIPQAETIKSVKVGRVEKKKPTKK
ncbi:UNVERIFIED_CONTAM: hypothetical protein HDU68_004792 [Siphonaria sp. JEL0065]|nr:hypothetical protein HDU68_004792 [Siphonaria sp. JEL0065]